jgi:hypothetical protein
LRKAAADSTAFVNIVRKKMNSRQHVNSLHTKMRLADHFDFAKPGTYRIRLVLPDPAGTSKSNVMTIVVPKRDR